jgi:hypothetical protein
MTIAKDTMATIGTTRDASRSALEPPVQDPGDLWA